MAYEIDLINKQNRSDIITLEVDDWGSKDITHTHTGVSTWQLDVAPHQPGLDDRILNEVRVYYMEDGTRQEQILFGELLATSHNITEGKTTLEGEGVAVRLKRSVTQVKYQNQPVWWALDSYVTDFLPNWSWTVIPPNTQTVKDGATVVSETDMGELVNPPEEHPVHIDGGNLRFYQSAFTQEAEAFDSASGAAAPWGASDFSNVDNTFSSDSNSSGEIIALGGTENAEWTFTTEYRIPAEAFELKVRDRFREDDSLSLEFEGRIEWQIDIGDTGTFETIDVFDTAGGDSVYKDLSWRTKTSEGDLTIPQGTHRLRVEVVRNDESTANTYLVDLICPHDARFSYDFVEEELDTLQGPQHYPQGWRTEVADVDEGSNITQASVSSVWLDGATGAGQAWHARNNQGLSYQERENTASATWDFGADDLVGSILQVDVTLSRKGNRPDKTPSTGFETQELQEVDVTLTTDDLGIIEGAKEYSGTDFENLQTLHSDANMVYSVDHTVLTEEPQAQSHRPGDRVRSNSFDWLSLSYGRDLYDYANRAVGFTRRKSGGRDKVVREDESEQTAKGETVGIAEIFSRVDQDLSELRFETRNLLQQAVDGEVFHASGDIEPQYIRPGFTQDLDEVPVRVFLEEVAYSFGPGDASVSLSMGKLDDWNKTVVESKNRERQTRASIGTEVAEDEEPGDDEPEEEGDVDITITGTNSPIDEGSRLSVEFDATNNLSEPQEAQLTLEILGPGEGGVVETLQIDFTADETKSLEAGWQTEPGDAGNYTATVSSGTDSDSKQVTVEEPEAEGDASVTITGTNSPVTEGDDVVVTFDATNNLSTSQDIQFTLDVDVDTQVQDTVTLSFSDSETKTGIELRWTTEDGDAGDYTATVESGTDSDTAQVTVEEPDTNPTGDVDISNLTTNSPVEEEDVLVATFDATNNLTQQQDAEITLDVDIDGQTQDTTGTLSFTDGETKTDLTLQWQTEEGDAGDYTAEVASDTDSATASVTVNEKSTSGDLGVSITGTNSPVNEGEDLRVTVNVSNSSGSEQSGIVGLSVPQSAQRDFVGVTLGDGKTERHTLVWSTEDGDAGVFTAEVSSGTDSDTAQVEVEEVGPGPSGDVNVTITGTNSPVEESEALTVTFDATNNLSEPQEADLVLSTIDPSGTERDRDTTGTLSFTADETKTDLTLQWQTQEGDAGDYTAKVRSQTDSDTTPIKVVDDSESQGDVDITITGTNSPVEEGNDLNVDFEAKNNLNSSLTATLTLDVDEGTDTEKDFSVEDFTAGQTRNLTLTWSTEAGDAGDYTATVSSGTDSESVGVEVVEEIAGGDFDVNITGTNSPVEEGDLLDVDVTVTNNLTQQQQGTVSLSILNGGPGQVDTTPVDLGGGDSVDITLSWQTQSGDDGFYTAKVRSGTDSDSQSIRVFEEQPVGDVNVTITGTNSPVLEGNWLDVSVEATKDADTNDTLEAVITLALDGNQEDTQTLLLEDGETINTTLSWLTQTGDAGDYTARVDSGDDSDTAQVTVEEPDQTFDYSLSVTCGEFNPGDAAPSTDVSAEIQLNQGPVIERDILLFKIEPNGTQSFVERKIRELDASTTVDFEYFLGQTDIEEAPIEFCVEFTDPQQTEYRKCCTSSSGLCSYQDIGVNGNAGNFFTTPSEETPEKCTFTGDFEFSAKWFWQVLNPDKFDTTSAVYTLTGGGIDILRLRAANLTGSSQLGTSDRLNLSINTRSGSAATSDPNEMDVSENLVSAQTKITMTDTEAELFIGDSDGNFSSLLQAPVDPSNWGGVTDLEGYVRANGDQVHDPDGPFNIISSVEDAQVF